MYYDKTHKVPVWLVVDLAEEKTNALVAALSEDGAHVQEWPSSSFASTVKSMSRLGWSHIVDTPYPKRVPVEFLSVAASKHIKSIFGENVIFGRPTVPYQHALDRAANTEADLEKIFNAMLGLEEDIGISQIFDLINLKSKIYITSGDSSVAKVVARVSDKVVTVGRGDGFVINVKNQKPEEIINTVREFIDNLLGLNQEK
jgi:hypothetical protein